MKNTVKQQINQAFFDVGIILTNQQYDDFKGQVFDEVLSIISESYRLRAGDLRHDEENIVNHVQTSKNLMRSVTAYGMDEEELPEH